MKTNKLKSGWTTLESVVAVVVISLLLAAVAGHFLRENVTLPAAFKAWVKQTGNTNQLTYQEWRALLRATEQNNTTIIFLPQ